jgi:aerobic-type carbon monoxide dehydrogenase small subunit (CoxS/CutS family)
MPTTTFVINGLNVQVDAEVDTPLLWIIREQLKLTRLRRIE